MSFSRETVLWVVSYGVPLNKKKNTMPLIKKNTAQCDHEAYQPLHVERVYCFNVTIIIFITINGGVWTYFFASKSQRRVFYVVKSKSVELQFACGESSWEKSFALAKTSKLDDFTRTK